jgi:GntR family transcriptional regulator, transcriptional repressor for pyruvate dehydrogenase complex
MAAPARSLFRPPPRRRIPEDVAGQLRDAILDGQLTAGCKLPPERELALRFGVNRTSVRAALKLLAVEAVQRFIHLIGGAQR